MGEITLSDGKVVKLDLSKITFGEWRKFFSLRGNTSQDDAFIQKITGLDTQAQENLLRDDYRRVVTEIIKQGNQPLADPNSQSGSTSE